MKILYVSNLYGEDARGGAERIVAQEAEAFAAGGHDVVVVSGERKRDIPKGVCLPGEPWLCPPPGSEADVAAAYASAARRTATPGKPRHILYHPPNVYFYADGARHGFLARFAWHLFDMFDPRSAAILRRIVALEKPDVVHTHNLMGLGFRTPGMLRAMGVRHVHTVHDVQLLHPSGLLPQSGRSSAAARFPQAVYVACMRRLFGSPDTVIFPSEFLRGLHARAGFFRRSRVEVLRNPAPDVALSPRPAPPSPSFLFAGQLEPHKGISFLLGAWAMWEDRGGATLEIAGVGSLADEVRKRAESLSGVRVLGKLGREDMLLAFVRNAYLIVPSLVIENAPAAIMESFSRGTPAVAAAIGGIPELVEEGKTGFLFRPGDLGGAIDALRRAASALPAWSGYFERCMKKAQDMSLGAHVERLAALYAAKKDPA